MPDLGNERVASSLSNQDWGQKQNKSILQMTCYNFVIIETDIIPVVICWDVSLTRSINYIISVMDPPSNFYKV